MHAGKLGIGIEGNSLHSLLRMDTQDIALLGYQRSTMCVGTQSLLKIVRTGLDGKFGAEGNCLDSLHKVC